MRDRCADVHDGRREGVGGTSSSVSRVHQNAHPLQVLVLSTHLSGTPKCQVYPLVHPEEKRRITRGGTRICRSGSGHLLELPVKLGDDNVEEFGDEVVVVERNVRLVRLRRELRRP
eukprot:6195513-Pleurochrysis_carterae.AAC.1